MIDYLPGNEPGPAESGEIEYVGGPRGGQRDRIEAWPAELPAEGGAYRRSVACADDGALRYVWIPSHAGGPEAAGPVLDR